MNGEMPPEVYATLSGPVDPLMFQRVCNCFGNLVTGRVSHVHLLLQSIGGGVSDGVCLYNYLKSLPLQITTYNAGDVASIAVLVFLAGKHRKASNTAAFLIHRTTNVVNAPAPGDALKTIGESVLQDDARTEAILRSHLKIPPEKWAIIERVGLRISALDALELGLIHEIQDFAPPFGSRLFNI